MFSTGFSMKPSELAEPMDGETVSWMKRIATENKIILAGSTIIKDQSDYFNRFIWMQPDGNYGTYDKRHLFSYGGENREFTAGTKRFIAQVKGWKICTMICYDLRFPVWNRMANENEFDVLLFVANWPNKRVVAWQTLLRARAIENQCFVVAVNRVGKDGMGLEYSGESCVINPMGEIIYSKANDEDIATVFTLQKSDIEQTRKSLPFLNDKDDFILL